MSIDERVALSLCRNPGGIDNLASARLPSLFR